MLRHTSKVKQRRIARCYGHLAFRLNVYGSGLVCGTQGVLSHYLGACTVCAYAKGMVTVTSRWRARPIGGHRKAKNSPSHISKTVLPTVQSGPTRRDTDSGWRIAVPKITEHPTTSRRWFGLPYTLVGSLHLPE